MKLIALHLNRFKSFLRPQVFYFPQSPGLYFLTGRNELHTRLGANGAGKSTVWDALCWLFFDKTPRSLKAGDIAPWNSKEGAEVLLEYEHFGKRHILGRTWSPNKWWLETDGHKEPIVNDQSNPALAHLGTTFEPFLHSVLMAQGQDMFLDLKQEPMSALFGKVLQLDHWVDLSSKASKAASVQDTVSRTLESRLAKLQGSLQELRGSAVEQTFDEWERQRNADLDDLEERHRAVVQKQQRIKAKMQELAAALPDIETTCKELAEEWKKLQETFLDQRDKQRSLQDQCKVLQQQLDDLHADINALEHAKHCDACGRKWDRDSQYARHAQLDNQARHVSGQLNSLTLQHSHIDVSGTNRKMQELEEEQLDAEAALSEARAALGRASTERLSLNKDLDSLEQQAERLTNARNPAADAKRDVEQRRRQLSQELQDIDRQLQESQGQHMLKQFWVRGFKDIRLQEITEALTQLELEVNSGVDQLGLKNWELHFDADSETKKGTIKRGFTVRVLCPGNDCMVPWNAWSGGESQRLRLAGNLGLANLIRSRLGVTMPLEVWDEPTQFLSQQGVTDLLDALKRRAEEEQRQIWVVDHRSLGYGGFDGVVTVVKDRRGSRFETEMRIT